MKTINQVDVLTRLENLMGRRVASGGEKADLERYCQESFDYCWRYFPWTFSLKTATLTEDNDGDVLLPEDFDNDSYREFSTISEVQLSETLGGASTTNAAIIYDETKKRYKMTPAVTDTVVYQRQPPTLGTDEDGTHPFHSALVVAEGATIFSKQAENPTRADVTQEWDMLHSHLDRFTAKAYTNRPRRRARNFHDVNGTFTGDTGA